MAPQAEQVNITISPCPPADQLEPIWSDLENRSDGSLYQSWTWIGSLLETFRPMARLATARTGERVVGLALLGQEDRSSALHPRPPILYLNETGDPQADAIATEYNGMLAERGMETAVTRGLLGCLFDRRTPLCRELRLSGIHPAHWAEPCRIQGLAGRPLRRRQSAPFADLTRMDPNDPLRSLSSNSREQIRRSMRLFEKTGPLRLERAADAAQATDWLGSLEQLHTSAWMDKGQPGAFGYEGFARFHRHLIGVGFAQGVPDLLRLRAGDTILGYLYNFRWRNCVYAYQSGFCYETDPRWRPGLIAHVMAMRKYVQEGATLYRYLAGDARYKNSLSNDRDELCWMTIYRPTILRSIENFARQLRRAL